MKLPAVATSLCLMTLINLGIVNSTQAQYVNFVYYNPGRQLVYSKQNNFLPSTYEGLIPRGKENYTVVFKDGHTYEGRTKMQLNNGRSYLKFKEGKTYRRIYPRETKEIYITTKKGEKMYGMPAFGDTSWLFQVSTGKINTFSVVPSPGSIFISAVTKAPQLTPVRINQSNIIKMVQDNPKALKLAKKRRLKRSIEVYNLP